MTVDGHWLILKVWPEQMTTRFVERDGTRSWGFRSDPGWLTDTPVTTADAVYFMEYNDNLAEERQPGSTRLVRGRPGGPPEIIEEFNREIPELVVINDTVYMAKLSDVDGPLRTCFQPVEQQGPEILCLDGTVERLEPTDGGFTFVSYTSRNDQCADIYRVDIADAILQKATTSGCPHSGAAQGSTAVWTDWPSVDDNGNRNFFLGTARATVNGGPPMELGGASVGSVSICGGAFLWVETANISMNRPERLWRWTPTTGPEVVFAGGINAAKLEANSVSTITCNEGHFLFMEALSDLSTRLYSSDPDFTWPMERFTEVEVYTIDGAIIEADDLSR